jgi:hypothetical protein
LYTGPVEVLGYDEYDLDRTMMAYACEWSQPASASPLGRHIPGSVDARRTGEDHLQTIVERRSRTWYR